MRVVSYLIFYRAGAFTGWSTQPITAALQSRSSDTMKSTFGRRSWAPETGSVARSPAPPVWRRKLLLEAPLVFGGVILFN